MMPLRFFTDPRGMLALLPTLSLVARADEAAAAVVHAKTAESLILAADAMLGRPESAAPLRFRLARLLGPSRGD